MDDERERCPARRQYSPYRCCARVCIPSYIEGRKAGQATGRGAEPRLDRRRYEAGLEPDVSWKVDDPPSPGKHLPDYAKCVGPGQFMVSGTELPLESKPL